MAKIKWYKRDPNSALTGMMCLSLEERGAYNTILDLIYSNDGKVINDDRFLSGWMRCDVRVWKRIKESLLTQEKLYIDGDFIKSSVADRYVYDALHRMVSAKDASNKRWGKSNNGTIENNDLDNASVMRQESLTTTTTTLKNNKYKFEGKIIKLTEEDFHKWKRTYHAIPDIESELASLDAYYAQQNIKDWFMRSMNALKNKHQTFLQKSGKTIEKGRITLL